MKEINSLYSKRYKKGFTLIEIVVVIAILGVVSAISIPKLSGFSEKAKIKSDIASLEVLNRATKLYGATNNINSEDVFEGVTPNEDEARIELLVEDGLLEKAVKAQEKDKKFEWDIDGQTWKIGNLDGSEEEGDVGEGMTEDEAEAAGFIFDIATGTITGYNGPGGVVEIPSMIGGEAVKIIGKEAFAGTDKTNWKGEFTDKKNITSIIIPNTVTEIGDRAFQFGNLENALIPDSVIKIGSYAFKENNLTSVRIPNELKIIEEATFSRNNLTSVDIPTSVTSIGAYAFDLNKLSEVTIPAKVTDIGEHGFYGNKLDKVTIEGSDTIIGEGAFYSNILFRDIYNIKSKDNKGTWIPGGYLGLSDWVKIE